MYATGRPSFARITVAPSWANRPSAVCLIGTEAGSYGSISTIQPNRFGSFGSLARSNRAS